MGNDHASRLDRMPEDVMRSPDPVQNPAISLQDADQFGALHDPYDDA